MSLQAKLILPFLDENITKDDFTKDAGFVDIFMYNKNNPDLVDHVFLMYEGTDLTEQNANVFEKFRKAKNFYKFENIRINDHSYRLYTFVLVDPMLKNMHRDATPLYGVENKLKALKFWNLNDRDVNMCVLGTDQYVGRDEESVPELDYAFPAFGEE